MIELPESIRIAWAKRQPREQRFLIVLAIFIALAILAQGLWSAHNARTRLHKQIPQLRLQAEAMQRQAGEIRQLQTQAKLSGATAYEGASLLAAASTAAKTGGLGQAAMQLEGPRQIRLRANLPFDRWIEWLTVVQRDLRLRLVHCRIDADSPGMVKIDALLALPDAG